LIRSLKFSISNSNPGKLNSLDELWIEYSKLLQLLFSRLRNRLSVDNSYLKTLSTPLSARYRQCAKRQAMLSFKSWCRGQKNSNKKPPVFTSPHLVLNKNLVNISPRGNSFDMWVGISVLKKGKRVYLPIKLYKYANNFLKDWELVQGCRLNRNRKGWYLSLTFRASPPILPISKNMGVDIGYRKTVTTSEGESIGKIKTLCEKCARKKQGSLSERRTKEEIRNHIGRVTNQLIDGNSNIIVEDLKHLKSNKKGKWSRSTNRKFNSWYYPLILRRIRNRCEVVGVQCHSVNPAYTSQDCPECGHRDPKNRKNEVFLCTKCAYSADADYVGARNILSRFLWRSQELIVPVVSNQEQQFDLGPIGVRYQPVL